MLANKSIERAVSDKDKPILGYLQDIKLDLHENDFGFTLTFEFEENQYFEGTVLTKKFEMSKPNVIERCVGTEIKWKQGCDPTHVKKQKKKNKKKITINKKVPSFFDLFQTIDIEDDKNKTEGDDDDEE